MQEPRGSGSLSLMVFKEEFNEKKKKGKRSFHCGEHATIIYLSLLVHSRVLPVAWCVMPGQTEWMRSQWDLVASSLDRVRPYLGQAECTLIADRGLAGFPLVQR